MTSNYNAGFKLQVILVENRTSNAVALHKLRRKDDMSGALAPGKAVNEQPCRLAADTVGGLTDERQMWMEFERPGEFVEAYNVELANWMPPNAA